MISAAANVQPVAAPAVPRDLADAPADGHTIFGLDPVQVHARFWAARGVQVVRVGEPSEVVRGAELYLLLDPRSLPIFDLGGETMRTLNWVEPRVLTLRLSDPRDRGYREVVVTDADLAPEAGDIDGGHWLDGDDPALDGGGGGGESDRFRHFRRVYGEGDERLCRCALTPDREVAQLWQQAGDPLNGWRRLRRYVPRQRRAALALRAAVYDRADDAEVAAMLAALVRDWRRPHAAIPRAWRGGRELHRDPSSEVGDARTIGRVWVGAGRRLEDGQTVVGPAVLWDDPARRPAAEEVGDLDALGWSALVADDDDEDDDEPVRAAHPSAARRPGRFDAALKRAFDLGFAVLALIGTAPLWPLIMLLIWLEDGRPWFFGHVRQTRGGRPFECWKFRSMFNNAEEIKQRLIAEGKNEADGAQFFMEDDPRITRIGKVLRKTNLDELPQFWNVIRGDMSVVGPRPSPDKENQYNPAWREARLSVRPGITGLWQIRRTRAEGTDFQEWIKYDIEYVETRSFWGDLRIIWLTVVMILKKLAKRGDE